MRGIRFTAVLAVAVVVLTLAVAGAAAGPDDLDPDEDLAGSGTADDPYIVTNASELQAIQGDLTAHYKLGNDINASETAEWNNGDGFNPIGDRSTEDQFAGTFDGDGHVIEGLTVEQGGNAGLFGGVGGDDQTGEVRNVGLENVSITGGDRVGGLVGFNGGVVTNSYTTGDVSGDGDVGGLVGSNIGEVNKSYATGSINSSESVGGLVSYNGGEVNKSYATGSVDGSRFIGGLVGFNSNDGDVSESYATGSVDNAITDNFPYVGGLIGWNYGGNVSGSYATGNVTLDGSGSVGGLIANNDGDVRDSYWDTETTEQDDSDGGEGLSTEDMTGDRAENTMFEFGDTWGIVDTDSDDGREVSYPFLVDNEQDPAPGLQTIPFYAGGDGSISSPYKIMDWHELDNVRENLDANFTLSNELNGTTAGYDEVASESANDGKGFEPIGNNSDRFAGHFDGSGHSVLDLHIDRSSDNFVGLFGAIDGGTVENVEVVNVTIDGSAYVSGLVGLNVGVVANSSAAGSVEGTDSVGVLVGDNRGEVRESSTAGSVAGITNIGGLIGINHGEVHESSAASSVTGSDRVGGLVGDNINSQVSESYATGTVDGGDRAGGLVGRNLGPDAVVNTSYAVGDVSAEQNPDNPGGLVGSNENDATIEDAYWDIGTTNRSEAVGNPAATETTLVGFGEIGDTEPAAEMQGLNAIFEMHRLDFDSTWWVRIGPDDYPGLRALETGLDPTIDVTNEPVNEGETLTVDVTVTNTDSTERTQAVTLSVDREAVDVETDLTVSGDESQQVSLEWKTDSGDAGEHDIVVATADTADVATVQVNEAYNVSGTVEDTTFETGIGDIEVTVSGVPGEYTAETDENGEYTVKNVPESDESYDVIVDQEGWDRASTTTAVKDENVTGVDLEITGDARDSITLRDGITDEPLEGTTVRLEEGTWGIVENAFVADEDGEMEIVVPGDFTYSYTFSQPGYRNAEIPSRPFESGDGKSANYVLAGNAEITGTATDEVTGAGIEEATVTAQKGTGAYTAATNEAGDFTVENVPGGHDYDLTFEADGYNANSSVDVTVSDGATAEVDGTLLAAPFFAVEITETNSPVPVGRTLEVNATVTNRGESDTQMVTLNDTGFDDQQRDDRELTLEPGESEIVTLEWQTAESDVGEGAVSVATANESADVVVTVESMYAGGNGIEDDPYQIENWYHLHNVRKNLDDKFVLNNDLNESTAGYDEVASETADDGAGFEPVGEDGDEFTGHFDGDGRTISDLYIQSDESHVGLFGYVKEDGTVENVGLEDASVEGSNSYVGGLVGLNVGGTVSESYATGSVKGSEFVGGLVGYNFGTVSESYATGSVKNSGSYVGGLVGINDFGGEVRESYATGSVEGSDSIGGLAGVNNEDVADSYWDIGTTTQEEPIGGGSDGTNVVGFGDTTDAEPASEMQGINATGNMAALEFPDGDGTWHVVEGDYPALAWEDTDPFFDVSITETNSPVVGGETLTVTMSATNWGADGTQLVTLTDTGFTDEQQDDRAVTLESGESAEFTLEWDTDSNTHGDGDVTVESTDDQDTQNVTIESAPADTINADITTNDVVADGVDEVEFTVTLEDEFGNPVEDATVGVDDAEDIDDVDGLDAEDTETTDAAGKATFTATSTDSGEFTVQFGEENAGSDTATATFKAADADSLSIVGAPESMTAGESVTLTIQATDRFDNPTAAQELVDFEVVSEHDGEVFNDGSLTLDGDGNATVTMVEGEIATAAVDHTVTATAADIDGDTVDIDVGAADAETLERLDAPDAMTAGDSLELVIDATDQYGNPATDQELTDVTVDSEHDGEVLSGASLSLNDSGQGTLSIANGEVTTADPTHTLTVATESGITEGVDLEVAQSDVETVELEPDDDQTITAGGTVEFDATAYDAYDNIVEDDETVFEWENADDGTFDETVAGTYSVIATLDDVVSESVTVTLEPADIESVELEPADRQTITAGETVDFDATAFDAYGNLVEDDKTAFAWQNTTDGTFEEATAGTYDVTATIDGVNSDTVSVTVEPANVDSVTIDPDAGQQLEAGTELEFDATAYDAFDNVVEESNAGFEWTNATAAGVFENTTAGTYDVTATIDSVTSPPTTVTVLAPANFSVAIDDYPTTVVEGDSMDVEVTITNAGDLEGTQNVTLSDFGGDEVDTESMTLGAGENSSRTLVWQTDSSDVGEGTVTVATDNESAVTETIEVEAAPIPTRPSQSPASFDVTIDTVTDNVTEGEEVTVNATIDNSGQRSDTQEITLSNFEGDVVNTTEVSLSGGEQTSLSLSWLTTIGDADEGSLTVGSEDDTATTDAIVVLEKLDPAFFELTDFEVPSEVEAGETFDVSVVVTNTGDRVAEQPIVLSIDEAGIEETTLLTLEGSETEMMTLENVSVDSPGVYTVELSSDDVSVSGSVTVNDGAGDADDEASDQDDTSDQEDGPIDSDGLPGFGVVLTLFVLLVTALFSVQRRK
ncbi:GLUG motif-containing protein [Natronorubrum bangense]|uniref:GLUG domain protein n=2 Tax=Natronorubrum bangense TaxID=61858 RepID=L9WBE6_9EURY|nr:GLUG motif-containing protein [Natronorubrum bangense]ELY45623.1 GLUG domain protein [Natronorubrum bangense JCM 10635]QCC56486.1 hypothetical protein DV706_18435 [Natronorubrum bangense]